MSSLDQETARLIDQEAEYAEATRDDPYPPGVAAERRNRRRASVYSVRLSDDEVAAIQRLADAAGVPSSTMVRSWIVEHITRASGGRTQLDPVVRETIHSEVRAAVREALDDVAQRAA
jgi:predicted transcriptional regulator